MNRSLMLAGLLLTLAGMTAAQPPTQTNGLRGEYSAGVAETEGGGAT